MTAELYDQLGLDYKLAETNFHVCCPFCHDAKYHLRVYLDNGGWMCFRCGQRGAWDYLLWRVTGRRADVENTTAVDGLVDFNLVTAIQEVLEMPLYREYDERLIVPIKFPRWAIPITRKDREVLQFLKKRGFGQAEIITYGLRKSTDGQHLFIPYYEDDALVYWQTRSIYGKTIAFPSTGEVQAGASSVVFGLDVARRAIESGQCDNVIVTEGWADAIAAGLGGVALGGKTISEQQKKKLALLRSPRYTVLLDGDGTEVNSMYVFKKLELAGLNVGIAHCERSLDPCDMGRAAVSAAVMQTAPPVSGQFFQNLLEV